MTDTTYTAGRCSVCHGSVKTMFCGLAGCPNAPLPRGTAANELVNAQLTIASLRKQLEEAQSALASGIRKELRMFDRAKTAEMRVAELEEEWRSMATAPRDETPICGLYEDGETDRVFWSEARYCILGAPQGSMGPGWVSIDAGNLPVSPPVGWKPDFPTPPEKESM